MKIAVLADIHANYLALQAVLEDLETWKPDAVAVAGDVVNRGPRSRDCLDLVLEKQQHDGWLLVRGNHEDYVIHVAAPDALRSGPTYEVRRATFWTYDQLGGQINPLLAMPFQNGLYAPDGSELRVVHASMRGIRDGVYPETSDEDLREKIQLYVSPPAVLCVGHTHRPLVRSLNGTLVVNAGSVGLPFDGDTRAAYARLTWSHGIWDAKIVRIEYDLAQAEQDFFTTGYYPEAGPLVKLVLDELRAARSHLFHWTIRFQDAAWRGEISMDESVRRYMAILGIQDRLD